MAQPHLRSGHGGEVQAVRCPGGDRRRSAFRSRPRAPRRRRSCPTRPTRASRRRCSSRWTTACRSPRPSRFPSRGRPDAGAGPLPGRAGHDAVRPQRRLRLLSAPTSSRRAAWSAPSPTCAAPAAAAATSRATTSRRARRATATTLVEYLGTQPYSTGKVGMAGGSYVGITQYLAAEQRPPHLAAITPAVAISDLYRDGFAHGGIPNLFFDAPVHRRAGRARRGGRQHRPVPARGDAERRSSASRRRARSPSTTSSGPTTTPSTATARRSTAPTTIKVPALVIGGWRDGLLRGEPEMYQRARAPARGRDAPLHGSRARTRAAARRSRRSPTRPGSRTSRRSLFEFLDKHLRGAQDPGPPAGRVLRAGGATSTSTPTAGRRRHGTSARLGGSALAGAGERGSTSPTPPPASAWPSTGTAPSPPRRTCPTDQRLEGPQGLTFRTPALDRPLRPDRAAGAAPRRRLHARPTPTGTRSSPTSRPTAASRSSPRARCARRTARSTARRARPAARTTRTPTRSRSSRAASTTTTSRSGRPPTSSPPGTGCSCGSPRPTCRPTCPARSPSTATARRTRASTSTAGDQHRAASGQLPRRCRRPGRDGGGLGVCLSRRSPIGPRNIGRVRLGFTRARLLRLPARAPRLPAAPSLLRETLARGGHGGVLEPHAPRTGEIVVTTARVTATGGFGSARPQQLPPGLPEPRADRARCLPRAARKSSPLRAARGRVRFIAVAGRPLARDRGAIRRLIRALPA